ncbi:MAG: ATP-dependent sacrificial sulfur transferase LarE [Thermoplasmata archaeon]|nr:MAG: ATP-dependent sacrificial sulfur transferase LarE [Thermoplasmata archaeon]
MNHGDTSYQLDELTEVIGKEDPELAEKYAELCNSIKQCRSCIVAFSGGVDSALLAYLCSRLGPKCLCVTADSLTLPRSELSEARAFGVKYGLNLRFIQHNELSDDRFAKNDEKRCYYCKDGLFTVLNEIKDKEGYECIFDGSNHDDLDDFRPGREAAVQNKVRSPLLEAKMSKEDIRKVSKALGLSTWDKPQMACLSSRFPRHTRINEEDLKRVEKAEEAVKALGFRDVRVRIHGEIARIEIGRQEKVDIEGLRKAIPAIKALGFKYVALDLEGYRTGSLNE